MSLAMAAHRTAHRRALQSRVHVTPQDDLPALNLSPMRARHDVADAARMVLAGLDSVASAEDDAIERRARRAWVGKSCALRSALTRAPLQRKGRLCRADLDALLPPAALAATPSLQHSASDLIRQESGRCASVSDAAHH